MAKIFFAFVGLSALFYSITWGQNYEAIAPLKRELQAAKSDTLKAEVYNELSYEYQESAPDTARIYAEKGLYCAKKSGKKKYIAKCLRCLGGVYLLQNNYAQALIVFEQSRVILETLGDKIRLAGILNNIGLVYFYQGDYPKALAYYQRSRLAYETTEQQPQPGLADVLANLALLYETKGDYAKAFSFYRQCQTAYEKIENGQKSTDVMSHIGRLFVMQGKYEQALAYFQKCQTIYEAEGNKNGIATQLDYIGNVYFRQGEYSKALRYSEQSLRLLEELDIPEAAAIALNSIAETYLHLSKPDKALEHIKKATALALQIDSKEVLVYCYDAYARIDSALGDSRSALAHYKLYVAYKDSLFNEEKTKEIGKIEGKYEIEKAQEAEKRKQDAEEKAKQRQNNLQYLLIFCGVAVFFLGLFFIGRLKLPLIFSEGIIFFAFLMLFEYIHIVTDPFLEQYTGGVPIQKLGLNTLLAGIFTPLHRFLEGKLKKKIIYKGE